MRAGLGMGEWWRGCSGRVKGTSASNPGRGEGRSSTPRPTWASVRGLGHLGPILVHGAMYICWTSCGCGGSTRSGTGEHQFIAGERNRGKQGAQGGSLP
jgi:hypothetical protein